MYVIYTCDLAYEYGLGGHQLYKDYSVLCFEGVKLLTIATVHTLFTHLYVVNDQAPCV